MYEELGRRLRGDRWSVCQYAHVRVIRYMLDTNACTGVIKDKLPSLRERLLQVSTDEVAISQISVANRRAKAS